MDVAAPVDRQVIRLTNRDWSFTKESLRDAARAKRCRLLNDFEALAWSLPHIAETDLVQIGGEIKATPLVKVVLGPGTGLGMATFVPLPSGGLMPHAGDGGPVTLPVKTMEEFLLKDTIPGKESFAEMEDIITGPGHLML